MLTSTENLDTNMHAFMRSVADAWRGEAAAMRDEQTGRAYHRTFSGKPLPLLVTDADAGEEITDGIYSRGRRWDLGEDIGFSADAIQSLQQMATGFLKRSKSAIDTGLDISQLTRHPEGALAAFRSKVREDTRWARAITPARVDDAQGLFLVGELIHNLEELVRVERAQPYARQILPMRFLNAPGADSYRFTVLDEYGDAQWTSNFDGSPPMVGQKRQQIRRPLEYLWMGAQWGLRELMQWQQARVNGVRLPDFATERPRIAREAILRQENLWLFFGGPAGSGILGLLSPNSDPALTPTLSGQGIKVKSSVHWANLATPQALVKVITDEITAISQDGVELADTILMPIGLYNYCGTTQWPDTDKMILSVLIENLRPLGIKEIVAVPELTYRASLEAKFIAKKYDAATAKRYAGGYNGKDCMVILSRRPEKIAGIVGQDVKSLAPEVRPAVTSVTFIMSSGGCEVRYPNAHRIVTFDAYSEGGD